MKNYDFTPFYIPKPVALVGMMGCGKSTIGKRLARRLSLPFLDSDQEVEAVSGGYSVVHIYEQWGKDAFKDAEHSVIKRLVETEPSHVLSTGDSAFITPQTKAFLQEHTVTIWLKADFETLLSRVQNRRVRPQLMEGDPEEILKQLIDERYSIYEQSDLCVESNDETYQDTVERIIIALKEFLYPSLS